MTPTRTIHSTERGTIKEVLLEAWGTGVNAESIPNAVVGWKSNWGETPARSGGMLGKGPF